MPLALAAAEGRTAEALAEGRAEVVVELQEGFEVVRPRAADRRVDANAEGRAGTDLHDHAARQRWIALSYAVVGLAMWLLFATGQPQRMSELVFGGVFLIFSAAFGWDTWRLLSAAERQGIKRTTRS